MSMITLNVVVVLGSDSKKTSLRVDENITAAEFCVLVKEKFPESFGGLADFALYHPPDQAGSGAWLHPEDKLGAFGLDHEDTLWYMRKKRELRVRMLDGTTKTLQVDEEDSASSITALVCQKIMVTNYEEYGLCREGEAAEQAPSTGSLKKNSQDQKFDSLSKKLKTDSNEKWLDPLKTLRDQSVDLSENVLLKRKLFFSDRDLDTRVPAQLRLLFSQTLDAILEGTNPVTEETAVIFAGIQCQVQFKDYQEIHHGRTYIKDLKQFLPVNYINSWNIDKKVIKEHKSHAGLGEHEAMALYVKKAQDLPTYGVTFFLVKEKEGGKRKLVPRLLGINAEAILRLDENTKEILQTWPLSSVHSYRDTPSSFSLQFGNYCDKEYQVKTKDGRRIKGVLESYIDLILKNGWRDPRPDQSPKKDRGQSFLDHLDDGSGNKKKEYKFPDIQEIPSETKVGSTKQPANTQDMSMCFREILAKNIEKNSSQSFIDKDTKETFEEEQRHVALLESWKTFCENIKKLEDQLYQKFQGRVPRDAELASMEVKAQEKLTRIQDSITTIFDAFSDKTMDYSAVHKAVTRMDEDLPGLVRDVKALAFNRNKQKLVNHMKTFCFLIKMIVTTAVSDDREKLFKVFEKYSTLSKELFNSIESNESLEPNFFITNDENHPSKEKSLKKVHVSNNVVKIRTESDLSAQNSLICTYIFDALKSPKDDEPFKFSYYDENCVKFPVNCVIIYSKQLHDVQNLRINLANDDDDKKKYCIVESVDKDLIFKVSVLNPEQFNELYDFLDARKVRDSKMLEQDLIDKYGQYWCIDLKLFEAINKKGILNTTIQPKRNTQILIRDKNTKISYVLGHREYKDLLIFIEETDDSKKIRKYLKHMGEKAHSKDVTDEKDKSHNVKKIENLFDVSETTFFVKNNEMQNAVATKTLGKNQVAQDGFFCAHILEWLSGPQHSNKAKLSYIYRNQEEVMECEIIYLKDLKDRLVFDEMSSDSGHNVKFCLVEAESQKIFDVCILTTEQYKELRAFLKKNNIQSCQNIRKYVMETYSQYRCIELEILNNITIGHEIKNYEEKQYKKIFILDKMTRCNFALGGHEFFELLNMNKLNKMENDEIREYLQILRYNKPTNTMIEKEDVNDSNKPKGVGAVENSSYIAIAPTINKYGNKVVKVHKNIELKKDLNSSLNAEDTNKWSQNGLICTYITDWLHGPKGKNEISIPCCTKIDMKCKIFDIKTLINATTFGNVPSGSHDNEPCCVVDTYLPPYFDYFIFDLYVFTIAQFRELLNNLKDVVIKTKLEIIQQLQKLTNHNYRCIEIQALVKDIIVKKEVIVLEITLNSKKYFITDRKTRSTFGLSQEKYRQLLEFIDQSKEKDVKAVRTYLIDMGKLNTKPKICINQKGNVCLKEHFTAVKDIGLLVESIKGLVAKSNDSDTASSNDFLILNLELENLEILQKNNSNPDEIKKICIVDAEICEKNDIYNLFILTAEQWRESLNVFKQIEITPGIIKNHLIAKYIRYRCMDLSNVINIKESEKKFVRDKEQTKLCIVLVDGMDADRKRLYVLTSTQYKIFLDLIDDDKLTNVEALTRTLTQRSETKTDEELSKDIKDILENIEILHWVDFEERMSNSNLLEDKIENIEIWVRTIKQGQCDVALMGFGQITVNSILDIGVLVTNNEQVMESEKENFNMMKNEIITLVRQEITYASARTLRSKILELQKMIRRILMRRLIQGFLVEDEHFLDETYDVKEFLEGGRIVKLIIFIKTLIETAYLVAISCFDVDTCREINEHLKEMKLIANQLARFAHRRNLTPSDVEELRMIRFELRSLIAIITGFCDLNVDPMVFVQVAGETIRRLHGTKDESTPVFTTVTRLAKRVLNVVTAASNRSDDKKLTEAVHEARGEIIAEFRGDDDKAHHQVEGMEQLVKEKAGTDVQGFNEKCEKILKVVLRLEVVLDSRNIFTKEPEPNQPMYNAALDFHARISERWTKDNEIVAMAQRMAVLMAKLSEYIQSNNQIHDATATALEIVNASREVVRLANLVASECTDKIICTNLHDICKKIPTISAQLNMLIAISASKEHKDYMDSMARTVGTAKNLMQCITELVDASTSAFVNIRFNELGSTQGYSKRFSNVT